MYHPSLSQSLAKSSFIVPLSLELIIESPADIICIPLQSLENATPQTIDFVDIAKFLRAELDNFPGLKTTMIDEVGYTLLALIVQQTPDNFPYLIAVTQVFHEWLSWLSRLW